MLQMIDVIYVLLLLHHTALLTGEFIATGSLGGAVSIWSLASGTSVSRVDYHLFNDACPYDSFLIHPSIHRFIHPFIDSSIHSSIHSCVGQGAARFRRHLRCVVEHGWCSAVLLLLLGHPHSDRYLACPVYYRVASACSLHSFLTTP